MAGQGGSTSQGAFWAAGSHDTAMSELDYLVRPVWSHPVRSARGGPLDLWASRLPPLIIAQGEEVGK